MRRKLYQPTDKQVENWSNYPEFKMPEDSYFKDPANRTRRNKRTPWGLFKRDWLASQTNYREYQEGLWQGRVDAVCKLEYQEKTDDPLYNIGYYRGYTQCESNLGGFDQATRERLLSYKEK